MFNKKVEVKIFDKEQGNWRHKVNFVDDNNVFVGYDMSQDCCETADWFISDYIQQSPPKKRSKPKELEGFFFDKTFMEKIEYGAYDEGGCIIFRLVREDGLEKYIHIYNIHNGYYGHGFEFQDGDNIIKSGSI